MKPKAHHWFSSYDKHEMIVWAVSIRESVSKLQTLFKYMHGLMVYEGNFAWDYDRDMGIIHDD